MHRETTVRVSPGEQLEIPDIINNSSPESPVISVNIYPSLSPPPNFFQYRTLTGVAIDNACFCSGGDRIGNDDVCLPPFPTIIGSNSNPETPCPPPDCIVLDSLGRLRSRTPSADSNNVFEVRQQECQSPEFSLPTQLRRSPSPPESVNMARKSPPLQSTSSIMRRSKFQTTLRRKEVRSLSSPSPTDSASLVGIAESGDDVTGGHMIRWSGVTGCGQGRNALVKHYRDNSLQQPGEDDGSTSDSDGQASGLTSLSVNDDDESADESDQLGLRRESTETKVNDGLVICSE